MEREIKIEYNPKRTYALQSGVGHEVGLLSESSLTTLLASVSKVYVGPAGNDSNSGNTEGSPVRTLARGIEAAVANSADAVVLLPGFHTYFASHNTYGKQIIGMTGAKLVCIGTDRATIDSAFQAQKFSFDSQAFCIQKVNPAIPDHDHLGGYTSGTAVWNTGRSDLPTPASKANRLYIPLLSGGGTLRLLRLRLYKDIGGSEVVETPSPTESQWAADMIPELEVFFAAKGYPSVAFPSGDANLVLSSNHYNSLVAMTDGNGEVFVVTRFKCDLSGGTAYRNMTVIWHNGLPQYFYETPLSPTEADGGPLCYGSATTPGPMLRTWYMYGGGGYTRHTAIQANKRIGDPGYEYSVSGPAVPLLTAANYARICAVYRNGVPMFSSYVGNGQCWTAQQMSDAFQAAGSYAALSPEVKTILESTMLTLAANRGFQRTAFSIYNRFNATGDYVGNVNPNSPFMVSMSMTAGVPGLSGVGSQLYESAEALCDNLFYGGAVINLKLYSEIPCVTKLRQAPYSYGGEDLTIPVHGLGVNSRLQNCEIAATDIGTQRIAYNGSAEITFNSAYRTRQDRISTEAWFNFPDHVPALDAGGSKFSNFVRSQSVNYHVINRMPLTSDARVRNSVFVGLYQLSELAELWHVSAANCAYATKAGELVYGCGLAYFSGYYLTADASPMTISYSVIREAISQNLIPPGSTVTNSLSADPLFKSVVNPYDLRLQAVAKDDFFDSPALAFTPEVSFFGGPREAGAYDDKGTVEVTWDSFLIVFPWAMPTESDRTRVANRRRDGVRAKLSVGKNTVRLPLQWRVALSEQDLRNLESVLNADESLVRVYFHPVARPAECLTGYVDQSFKHGGPMGLLSKTSDAVQLDIDCAQPPASIYDYL